MSLYPRIVVSMIFTGGLTVFMILSAAPAYGEPSKERVVPASTLPLKVIIDPGHGGSDNGAVKNRVREASITLKVARYLKSYLSSDSRFEVIMTRTKDENISLKDRALLAKKHKADLFISIHVNASVNGRAQGAEIYFENQLPPHQETYYLANFENQEKEGTDLELELHDDIEGHSQLSQEVLSIINDLRKNQRIKQSAHLAKILVKNWKGPRKSKRHVLKQAPFYVTRNVVMPSVLLELGYLTSRRDKRYLIKSTNQKRMARGIYTSLIKYKEGVDKNK